MEQLNKLRHYIQDFIIILAKIVIIKNLTKKKGGSSLCKDVLLNIVGT